MADQLHIGSTVQSPTHLSYPNYQSSSLQTHSQRTSRLRSSSASLPLGLDLRTPFRSAVGTNSLQSAAHSPTSTRTPSTSQLGGGVSSSYSASSFPSAPLSAPVDYSLPRASPYRPPPPTGATDYSIPQMSAPIAPPTDFSQAFQASMSSAGGGSSRNTQPLRDNFGGSALGLGHGHHNSASHHRNSTTDDYSAHDPLGMKRKRSYSGTAPAVSGAQGSGAYGAAA